MFSSQKRFGDENTAYTISRNMPSFNNQEILERLNSDEQPLLLLNPPESLSFRPSPTKTLTH